MENNIAPKTRKVMISESERDSIFDDCKTILDFKVLIDYSAMAYQNLKFLCNKMKEPPNIKERFFLSNYNRLLLNFLSTLDAFWEYCENNLKWPKSILSRYYDCYFECKLLYNLRNFVLHHKQAITDITLTIPSNRISFCMKKSALLNDPKINKKIKADINAKFEKDKRIDIRSICDSFLVTFKDLVSDILVQKSKLIFSSYRIINQFIISKSEENVVHCFEKDDETFGLEYIKSEFLLNITQLAFEFGYFNDAKCDIRFASLFTSISKEEFGENGREKLDTFLKSVT